MNLRITPIAIKRNMMSRKGFALQSHWSIDLYSGYVRRRTYERHGKTANTDRRSEEGGVEAAIVRTISRSLIFPIS